jgi:hypothetical protein
MRFITLTFFTLVATLSLRPAEAQSLYTCGDGTVRSVQTLVEMVAGPPVVSMPDRWGEPVQHVERMPAVPHEAYLVTVQLFNVNYTAESFTDVPENFDPTKLTENEPISICVNRDRMILDRRDGTDFRANLIRTERVRQVNGTSR